MGLLCVISYVVCSPALLDRAFVFEFGALLCHASNGNGDNNEIFILSFDGKMDRTAEVSMLRSSDVRAGSAGARDQVCCHDQRLSERGDLRGVP